MQGTSREQAGVPEGNEEGGPEGNRTLVNERRGPARFLAERPRRDWENDHRADVRQDGLRRWKTWSQLLLLARLRRSKQPSRSFRRSPSSLLISTQVSETSWSSVLKTQPSCRAGVPLFANGEAHSWPAQIHQHLNTDRHRCPRRVQGRRTRVRNPIDSLLLCQRDPRCQVLHHWAAQRPEFALDFGWSRSPQITEVLKLHEVKPEAVDSDIKLYFRTQLSNVVKNRSDCNLTENWPSSSDIEILCKKAAGYFIYASTVVKFVSSENYTPTEQLAKIISSPQSTVHEGRSGVDLLYTQVLEQTVDIDVDDKEFCTRRKTILGAVVLMVNPLSMKALSDLLGISNISSPLRSLHSLLLVPNDEALPSMFSTNHFRTSSQTKIVAKTRGSLWSPKSIMQKSYFHASSL
jgi:hypothetical protein